MKLIMMLLITFLANENLQAQQKLLSPDELKQEPWFYTLEDAIENPEKVYKLSITWEKLKEFPKEIFHFVNLQQLDLMDNEIRTIPAEISKLKNLQNLLLSNNKIAALPESLKELEFLEELGLERNRMVGLPDWIVEIKNLKKIVLGNNLINDADWEALSKKFEKIKITK